MTWRPRFRFVPNIEWRFQRILFTGLSSSVVKGLSIVFQTISVPLILSLYGQEIFGLFATIYAILNILNFTDLGLGWSLQNELPSLIRADDWAQINRYVANTFFALVGIAALLLVLLWAFTEVWSVSALFGVTVAPATFDRMFFYAMGWFLLGIPFSISNRIYSAFQEMYYINLWRLIYWVLTFSILGLTVYYSLAVEQYVLLERGANFVYFAVGIAALFLTKLHLRLPRLWQIEWSLVSTLISGGVKLLVVQVMFVLLSSIDSVLILRLMSEADAARFAVGMKLVTIASTPIIMFISPIIPAVTDAFINNDRHWITHEFVRRVRWFVLPLLLLPMAYLLCGEFVLELWVGDTIRLSFLEHLAFALFLPAFILLVFVYSTMFNKLYAGFLTKQLLLAIGVLAILKTAAVLLFGRTIPSVVFPTVITILGVLFVPFMLRFHRDRWIMSRAEIAAARSAVDTSVRPGV